MATRYSWTTGPVSSSEGLDNVRVEVLNNTSYTRSVRVRLYNLSFTPKRRLVSESFSMAPFSTTTVDIPLEGVERWEVQASAYSRSVRVWVSGRSGTQNLVGNTVLNSELIEY